MSTKDKTRKQKDAERIKRQREQHARNILSKLTDWQLLMIG